MNFCILYAAIWIIELILYSFAWSDLNKPLTAGILILILTTVFISLILGYKFRNTFQFRYISNNKMKYRRSIITIIVCTYILEFIYCRQIPLFSILRGTSEYSTYTGIHAVHVLIVTYACYYSFYSYYLFEASGNRKFLFNTLIIAFLHLLIFSRVSLMILFFEIVIVKIAKHGGLVKILNPKKLCLLLIVLMIVLYGFGVLGNLRCGCRWDDSTIISSLGQYNDKYPSFLPSQFKWAYTYITSPLANLNNGIIVNGTKPDISLYFASYVPDFLNKRLFPDYLTLIPDTRVVWDLNAVSGYYNFYYFGGLVGALFMYLVLVGGTIGALRHLHFSDGQYFAFLMISTELVSFLFFYNVIYLSQCSFCLVYPLLTAIFGRIKVRI